MTKVVKVRSLYQERNKVQSELLNASSRLDFNLEASFKRLIRQMGVSRFTAITGISKPSVYSFLRRRIVYHETFRRYIKPFGIEVKIIAVPIKKRAGS